MKWSVTMLAYDAPETKLQRKMTTMCVGPEALKVYLGDIRTSVINFAVKMSQAPGDAKDLLKL